MYPANQQILIVAAYLNKILMVSKAFFLAIAFLIRNKPKSLTVALAERGT
jgi:hypothetical protein